MASTADETQTQRNSSLALERLRIIVDQLEREARDQLPTERELAARPEDQPRPRPELRVHRVHCARKSHCAKALGAPYPPCAADGQEQPQ